MTVTTADNVERMSIAGVDMELLRRGNAKPLLLLHGFQHICPDAAFVEGLAAHAQIIAPSHPGFGGSARPADFDTVYDLVNLYLELLDQLGTASVDLMGLSFGGWLAAELAILAGARIDRLILVDALGIKVSDRETPDILDVFNTHPDAVVRASWHDAAKWAPNYDAMADGDLINVSRNWAALARYGWQPYMHNPQLKRWLGRIKSPTLVLWGASDRIVKPSYGEAYAGAIPSARFELIAEAGHHPEIEQPQRLVERVCAFLET